MDDGELDFSNHEIFPSTILSDLPSSSFLDDFLMDTHACTHTHTCNPPGPDYSHTHTCYHVHTKLVPALSEDKTPTSDTADSSEKKSKKRPLGNREAVRKYREKKKAQTASLEEEVASLRDKNQQLMKRLQGQVVLEAEVARLKCLLVDIRGRIGAEIGSFPYQKSANQNLANPNLINAYVMNPCNMQCDDQVYCLHPRVDGRSGEVATSNDQDNGCGFENMQCLGNQNDRLNDLPGCGLANGLPVVNTSGGSKRKGGARAARAG